MLVVPDMVDSPTAMDPDHGHVTAGLHVSDDLEVGNELRADLVATGLHHPLFELLVPARRGIVLFGLHRRVAARQPGHAAVVFHSEQHPAALET